QEIRFFEQNRHRINFFTGRTSGMPDSDERFRGYDRQYFRSKLAVKIRIPKHFSDIHRNFLNQSLEIIRIRTDVFQKFFKRPETIKMPKPVYASLKRC